jgi:hypothetical protein
MAAARLAARLWRRAFTPGVLAGLWRSGPAGWRREAAETWTQLRAAIGGRR